MRLAFEKRKIVCLQDTLKETRKKYWKTLILW